MGKISPIQKLQNGITIHFKLIILKLFKHMPNWLANNIRLQCKMLFLIG